MRLWLLLAALVAVVAAGCGGEEKARLTLALDWVPNPDHVALFYAQDKGFFDERGIALEMKTPSDPAAGLKLVATGKFDLAVYYEGDLFFAAQEELPVVAVGALIPTPLNSLIALGDSKVRGPETIRGATIGVAGLPFDDAILATLRRSQGLAEEDVESANVGFNLVPALLGGKVDAVIGAYRNVEGIQLELETGVQPVIVTLEELGVPAYDELVIVANSDRLASEPGYADAVRGFLAALVEGTEGAQGDEAGALELVEAGTDYDTAFLARSVPATIALTRPPAGGPTGCLDRGRWQAFGRWMLENELLDRPIDAAAVASNEYLPERCPQ